MLTPRAITWLTPRASPVILKMREGKGNLCQLQAEQRPMLHVLEEFLKSVAGSFSK
jgi:hypothetical protein